MLSIEDKLAIHDLISLYGHIIDQRQFSRIHELFTEDAIYDVTDFDGGIVIGPAGIEQLWLESKSHPLAHHATNVIVSEDAAGDVSVISKGIGVQRPDGRTGSTTYHDIVEKRPEGWRMTKRVALIRRHDKIPAPS